MQKILAASLSTFHKRFPTCDSVTTIRSVFLFITDIWCRLFLQCILIFSVFLLCFFKCHYASSLDQSNSPFRERWKLMKRVWLLLSPTQYLHFILALHPECFYLKHDTFLIITLFHLATSKLSTILIIPSAYVSVLLVLCSRTSDPSGWDKN